MMEKRKHSSPIPISLEDPKDTIEPSLENRLEATDKFICEVLKLFKDL